MTNTAAVRVVAVKPGYLTSAVVAAGFIDSSSAGSGAGLTGQYFANQTGTFNPPATLTRVDPTVNFVWPNPGPGPDPTVGETGFSVRWTGSVQPQLSDTYTFAITVDDGGRLFINGQMIIDGWVDQPPTTYTASLALNAQQLYTIEMEYYQNGGGAQAELAWSSPSFPQTVIPESQLYPYTNSPPEVALNSPANGTSYTASASVTLNATADAQYNSIESVTFFANGISVGSVSNAPYILTTTGFSPGSYVLTAVATDGSGLMATSPPVNITINAGTGLPYGLTVRSPVPPFFDMPTEFSGTLPPLLSQTGVFADTPNMVPAAGLIPYSPNVVLWSDGAVKTRWIGLPFDGGVDTSDQQIGFSPTGSWSFPTGTVFVKHFALATNEIDPNAPLRRLETRLLVRNPDGSVYGVTYKWRPDYSDADLLTTSSNETIAITTPAGVVNQTWYYPSPGDCLQCHTSVANYVLGVNTRQLNGNLTYPSSGVTDNQLRTLNQLGLFNPAIDSGGITSYSRMSAVTNLTATPQDRSRSYIDANCAQCHQPGGSGPSFDARYDTPLANQNIINGNVIGNLGFDNAHVVTPDDIWRSILYQRSDTTDSTIKMPPLARNLVDTNAMAVIAAWINSLPGTLALAPPTFAPNGGSFAGSVSVTIQPPNKNATIYYTLDGSLPTTNSLLYSGPILLTNSVTLSANAFEADFASSVAASAQFTVLSGLEFTASGAFTTNGAFLLQLSGISSQNYILQASTDLVDWISIITNTPAANPFTLTDTIASHFPHRFYRAIQGP